MKKLLLIVLGISIIGMISTLVYGITKISHDKIQFEDASLEYVIRETLGSTNTVVSKESAKSITELDASNRGIKNLEGIDKLPNLIKLNLEGNRINDVSPLCKFYKLEELNLANNGITNLEAIKFDKLKELPNLKRISLKDNFKLIDQDNKFNLSDINLLNGLDTLEKLDLEGNNINDISPLANLVNLEELNLSGNKILNGSIEPISRLSNLKELNLRECDVNDISPIENYKSLIYLNIHSNVRIKSLMPIGKITELQSLIMRNVPIGDQISVIENLTNLHELNLRNTSISDISVLAKLFERGVLQDNAEVDIRDNPILLSQDDKDNFEAIRPFWNNITKRNPDTIPKKSTLNIFINETMPSNDKTIADEEGKYEDWIELYNPNEKNIDLTGYYLSDNVDDQKKWKLPQNTVISSNGYLILWASGKDETATSKTIHTNFKVSSDGESLILTEPDGETVVDYFIVPSGQQDVSYGRKPDGSSKFEYFDINNSTPGTSNNKAETYLISEKVIQPPKFSHKSGFYQEDFFLELCNDYKDAVVYYTLDGSQPDPNNVSGKGDSYSIKRSYGEYVDVLSPANSETRQKITYVYDGNPIRIKSRKGDANVLSNIPISVGYKKPLAEVSKSSVVRARAYKEAIPSEIVTHTFFVTDKLKQKHSLPVVCITTDSENFFDYEKGIYVPGKVYDENVDPYIGVWKRQGNYEERGDEWERPVHIEFFDETGALGFSQNVGVKIHGATTRTSPRKTLRIHARYEYDSENTINYNLFPGLAKPFNNKPIDQFKFFLLRNSGSDSSETLFRDALSQGLVSHTAIDTQAYRPAIMYLNGEYWGIHNVRERIDKQYFANKYDLNSDDIVIIDHQGDLSEGEEGDKKDYERILEYVKLNDMSVSTSYDYIKTKIDIINYMDYYISNIYFNNTDWPHNNMKFWRSKTGSLSSGTPYGHDGKWRWILFDTDFGFGHSEGTDFDTLSWAVSKINLQTKREDTNLLINSLLKNESFKTEFINRFADHLNSSFKEERVEKRILEMYKVLKPEIKEHQDRWNSSNWDKKVKTMVDFAMSRPHIQRQHIIKYFRLNGIAKINLNTDSKKGYIKINHIEIKDSTPGADKPDNWSGIYFKSIPIEVVAVPNPGYSFEGWESNLKDIKNEKSESITFIPDEDVNLTALFKIATSKPVEELIDELPSIEKLTLYDEGSIKTAKELVEITLTESDVKKSDIKNIDKLMGLETKLLELEKINKDRKDYEFILEDKIMIIALFLLSLIIAVITFKRLRYIY